MDRGIDIADHPTRLTDPGDCFAQQHAAVSAVKARIGVGKMRADVAKPRGPEYRVGNGMQQHIGIRMPEQSALVRDGDAADDQRPALHQGMYVEPLPYPVRKLTHSQDPTQSKSSGQVTLALRADPRTSSGRAPVASSADDSSVTSSPSPRARASASCNAPALNIWGVWADQRPARETVESTQSPGA